MSTPADDYQSFYAPRADAVPLPPPPAVPDAQSARFGLQPAAGAVPARWVPPQQSGAQAQHAAALAILGKKSAGLAAVLTLLLVGAGQMYLGHVGRGVAFLVAYVVAVVLMMVFIGFLLVPVVLIWALVDAVSLANQHNAHLARRLAGGY